MKQLFNPLLEEGFQYSPEFGNIVYVTSLADLPAPVAGVITLEANTTYEFCGKNGVVDLQGNRLVTSGLTTFRGGSSETSVLQSTGLVGQPLVTSPYTLAIQFMTFHAHTAIYIDGLGTAALDWTGVNFLNCENVGTIKNFANFVFTKGAFLNSTNLVFDGTFATAAFNTSFLSGRNTGTIITIAPTAIITRRFRATYSPFVALAGTTAIDFSVLATVPTEAYLLDTCSFAGGGTYLAGVQPNDNKAKFAENVGILNSVSTVNMYMKNNAIPTDVITQSTRYPMAGVTQIGSIVQRFSHDLANNAVTYTSNVSRVFKIQATLSLLAPSNNVIGAYIGINRAGNPIDATADRISESELYVTANGTRPDAGTVQCLTTLNTGDRVYIIVQNTSSTGDITVVFMNMIIEASPQ